MITFTTGSTADTVAAGAFYVLALWCPISAVVLLALGPYLHAPNKPRKEKV